MQVSLRGSQANSVSAACLLLSLVDNIHRRNAMGFFCAGYTASRVWIACGRTKSEHASRNRKPLCCAGLGLTGPPRTRDVEGRGEK